MSEFKSKHYRRMRRNNRILNWLKKTSQIIAMVIIGEYVLLNAINISLSQQNPIMDYSNVPVKIINLAVSEKPIFRVAEAYGSIKKNMDFDTTILRHHPIQVRGSRLDFWTDRLQDEEGAKIGYVVKF